MWATNLPTAWACIWPVWKIGTGTSCSRAMRQLWRPSQRRSYRPTRIARPVMAVPYNQDPQVTDRRWTGGGKCGPWL